MNRRDYTAPTTDYSRFISLLDTPSTYENGKLFIFDSKGRRVIAVDLVDVPSLVDGVTAALSKIVGNTDTISLKVDTTNRIVLAYLNDDAVAPINIKTNNNPKENNVLVFTNGSFEWRHSADIVDIEAQVSITQFQPVTDSGYIAKAELPITNKAIGLAINDALARTYVRVQTGSILSNPLWAWDTGASIYLQTDGTLSQTPPTSGFIQVIGNAVNPTSILLVQNPIIVL
ncbi:MAG: hypothetical protein GXO10_02930 [Crenarchaeota archaeon]|nr:hypothetical protein [Thermoproteota archaeon]